MSRALAIFVEFILDNEFFCKTSPICFFQQSSTFLGKQMYGLCVQVLNITKLNMGSEDCRDTRN